MIYFVFTFYYSLFLFQLHRRTVQVRVGEHIKIGGLYQQGKRIHVTSLYYISFKQTFEIYMVIGSTVLADEVALLVIDIVGALDCEVGGVVRTPPGHETAHEISIFTILQDHLTAFIKTKGKA